VRRIARKKGKQKAGRNRKEREALGAGKEGEKTAKKLSSKVHELQGQDKDQGWRSKRLKEE